jgi:hypothetical protein
MLAAVEAGQLLQVVWVSLLAGVGVTALFSVVVLAAVRSAEARRAGRDAAFAGYMALAGVALVTFGVAVALGVQVMLAK